MSGMHCSMNGGESRYRVRVDRGRCSGLVVAPNVAPNKSANVLLALSREEIEENPRQLYNALICAHAVRRQSAVACDYCECMLQPL